MVKRRQSFSARKRVRLEVISEPKEGTAAIIKTTSGAVVMRGEGSNDYVCGGCGAVLLEGVDPGQVQALVFKCSECARFNRINAPNVM